MDISKAHQFFVSTFTCARGFSFKAQLLAAPLEESSVYFFLPRRILKLDADSKVVPGDIVTSKASGHTWLCGENGPSEFKGRTIYKTLKAFEVTHLNATLVSFTKVQDNITGLQKKNGSQTTQSIAAVIEFTKTQEDEMRIGADLVRIITATPVAVGNKINEYIIQNVEHQLGLYFSTAKRQ